MVNFPGRDRRRRVLKDEVLAASNSHTVLRATNDYESIDAPRYSAAAGVENHPQVTDFVPRRYRTIATLVLIGAATTTGLSLLQLFVVPPAETIRLQRASALGVASVGSLASWYSAVVLLVASMTCLLTYSIRRHRIDDYRGRYRVWKWASAACLAMSIASVTGLHQLVAAALTHSTGWTPLHDDAVWWLVILGAPIGWTATRALLDMRECRLAMVLFMAAAVSYSTAAASYFGVVTFPNAVVSLVVVGSGLLMGHWLVLAAAVSYARFVILDAQGLIVTRSRSAVRRGAASAGDGTMSASHAAATAKAEPSIAAVKLSAQPAAASARAEADATKWVDGSRPESKRYDDEDENTSGEGRKLNKADRKRLRKLKSESRAA